MMLQIQNNGPDIIFTNYWDSEHAKRGFFYLSINAGAYRLLVPDVQFEILAEIRNTEYVVISRGPWPDGAKADAMEIMFEDNTDSPFSINIVAEQCDRLPGNAEVNKERIFTVWHRSGKALELKCYFRNAKRIPWLKPYERKHA